VKSDFDAIRGNLDRIDALARKPRLHPADFNEMQRLVADARKTLDDIEKHYKYMKDMIDSNHGNYDD
jgi:hypothetical protein